MMALQRRSEQTLFRYPANMECLNSLVHKESKELLRIPVVEGKYRVGMAVPIVQSLPANFSGRMRSWAAFGAIPFGPLFYAVYSAPLLDSASQTHSPGQTRTQRYNIHRWV
jgi:hypothetical protein